MVCYGALVQYKRTEKIFSIDLTDDSLPIEEMDCDGDAPENRIGHKAIMKNKDVMLLMGALYR